MRAESQLQPIQEFVELAFDAGLLNAYQTCLTDSLYVSLMKFHTKLFDEIVEWSDKYWLLLRTTFNHLMFLWVARPHLMSTFEHSIVGFGTSRELRSLDAEIKLYKLQTIIAEAVPKRYESFDLDMVSYHGAYIRTMTLMCVEGIVKNHVIALKEGLSSPQIEMTTNVLENIIR